MSNRQTRGQAMKQFKKGLLFTILVLGIFLSSYIVVTPKAVSQTLFPKKTTTKDAENHSLQLFEFSHYNRIIYANYSVISFVVLFEGPEVNISSVYAHYSLEGAGNWTTIELSRTRTVSEYRALYAGTLGPFPRAGNYFLKINATRLSVEHASLNLLFEVVKPTGIVFLDFSYSVNVDAEDNQYADIQIHLIGEDILPETVYVVPELKGMTVNKTKLTLVVGTNHTFVGKLSPITLWADKVRLTFQANTSTGKQYTCSNYFLLKGRIVIQENFLRSKLPAIIISAVIMISMTIVFIMARRKPPRTFQ